MTSMRLSNPLFSISSAALLVVAVVVGSAACSSSSKCTAIPPSSTPPVGVTFSGGAFGGPCSGDVYVGAGTGWAFCDNGEWAYTTTDPATDGFTEATPVTDGGPSKDTGPVPDGSQGDTGCQGQGQGQGQCGQLGADAGQD